MIEIHLYGSLRRFGPHHAVDRACVIRTSAEASITVDRLLDSLGIPGDEVGNVFLNGLFDPRGLNTSVVGLSRIGLFPRDMSLLYI